MTIQDRVTVPAYHFAGHLVLGAPEPAPLRILNPAAMVIWQGLVSGQDRDAIACRLSEAFDLSIQAARGHVDAAAATWWQECIAAPTESPRRRPDCRPRHRMWWRRHVYALCGRPIAVRFASRDLEMLIHPRFAHAEVPDAPATGTLSLSAVSGGFALSQTGRAPMRVGTREALLGAFVRRFVELSHPEAEWIAVLHAAAVADRDGLAILLPGANGSGKSTLVAGLVASGYRYLGDDCAPIDRSGRTVPVPFGISLKEGSWPVAKRILPGFEDATIHQDSTGRRCRYVPPPPSPQDSVRPRAIVFPCYRAEALPRRQELDPVEALRRLVAGRAWLSRRPVHLRGTLDLLARIPAYEIEFGSLADAVALVAEL